ncbi:MAG: glutamate decarboxylase [Halanaerobiales bacterium]|nr:glutamate decarboxylase [Halanaerobiales bacterium]
MWKVVYIAPNKEKVDRMKNRLTEEGFWVKIEPMGFNAIDGYQLLVPQGEAIEVADFLSQSYQF